MKRLLTPLLCICMAVVCLSFLGGCEGKNQHTAYSISKSVLELCSEEVEMTALTAEQTANYYGIPDAHLYDFSVHISSADDQYDTVAVFSYTDKEERTVLADAIAQTIKTNETTVKAVNDAEYQKLQNRIIMELEDKLILVISDNFSEIGEALEKMGAKKFLP